MSGICIYITQGLIRSPLEVLQGSLCKVKSAWISATNLLEGEFGMYLDDYNHGIARSKGIAVGM